MTIKYLYSGSSGNITLVSTDTTNIIIDCGVSYTKYKKAINDADIDIDAILITHEHWDHVSGLGPIARKTKSVIFIPEKSYEKIKKNLKNCKINFITGGEHFTIGDITVTAFSTRHDSAESVGYTLHHNNIKYSHITDTGVITSLIKDAIIDSNGLFIESDYDMYELELYPEYDDLLKMRISSNYGHLSNQQVIKHLLHDVDLHEINWVTLGHLSKKTNSEEILQKLLNTYIPKQYLTKINIYDDNPIVLTL